MNFSKELLLSLSFLFAVLFITGCGDDDDDDMDPGDENPEEVITDVNLTFTGGGTTVTASAVDPDGEGVLPLTVSDAIVLAAGTDYTLTIEALNAEDPDDPEDITAEIRDEAAEHQLFFAWTGDVFADPTGNGNTTDRSQDVNYNDDDGTLPLGLSTDWTTGDAGTGTFRIVLKHQPEATNGDPVKTATSTIADGDTDFDITWNITIE